MWPVRHMCMSGPIRGLYDHLKAQHRQGPYIRPMAMVFSNNYGCREPWGGHITRTRAARIVVHVTEWYTHVV